MTRTAAITGSIVATLAFALALETPAIAQDAKPKSTAATDLDQLAQRLVNQSAVVKEGELVSVVGGIRDFELLENIATHVRKVGAFALVVVESERMLKRSFTDVAEKYDSQEPKLQLALTDIIDVTILVDPSETERLLDDIPNIAARDSARAKAGATLRKKLLDNKMRFVEVGNGLYPTAWRARRFGMSHEALTQTFWQSVNIDYSNLQKRGEQIKAVLAAGKELRIRNPVNGTDLRMSIADRPVIVSDGIISAADVKQGGPAASVFLPAGEVLTTPVQGMADGRVVVQQLYFEDQPVQDLTLTFTDGKLKSMSGRGEGYAALKARYDATDDPGKALLGFVDFGINEKIQLPPTSQVGTWVPAGMVTIGVGNNMFFGGDNNAPFFLAAHLPGTTVTLDGKTIVEGGRLKL